MKKVIELNDNCNIDVSHVIGPVSKKYNELQKEKESSAVTYGKIHSLVIKRGNGSYIEDVDGNLVIDFLSGAGSLPLGHCHPELVKSGKLQMDTLVHGLDFQTPIKSEFVDQLINKLPENMRDSMKIHFCGPTGSDAVEAALKLCRVSHEGNGTVLAFSGAYHGCSHSTMAISGNNSTKSRFSHLMPGVHFLPFQSVGQSDQNLNHIEEVLTDSHSGVGSVCAVIMELVQGEGGVNVADYDFVRRLRDLTQNIGIPLIVDEIQTGCGRTGSWYSFEQYNIEPDIIVSSKALSGLGLPLSVMLYNKNLLEWTTGDHIGTFRGNQVAFATANKYMELYETENIQQNVQARHHQITTRFKTYIDQYEFISEYRGLGLMLGLQIVHPISGVNSYLIAKMIQKKSLEYGLLIELGGRHDSVARVLPPLNIDYSTTEKALSILDKVLHEVETSTQENSDYFLDEYCI